MSLSVEWADWLASSIVLRASSPVDSASPVAGVSSHASLSVCSRREYRLYTNFLITAFDGILNSSVSVEREVGQCRYCRTPACTARRSRSWASRLFANVLASSEDCFWSWTMQNFRAVSAVMIFVSRLHRALTASLTGSRVEMMSCITVKSASWPPSYQSWLSVLRIVTAGIWITC